MGYKNEGLNKMTLKSKKENKKYQKPILKKYKTLKKIMAAS